MNGVVEESKVVEREAMNVISKAMSDYEMQEIVATTEMANIKTIKNDLEWVKVLENYLQEQQQQPKKKATK